MICIPIYRKTNPAAFSLVVIFDEDGQRRLAANDPAMICLHSLPEPLPTLRIEHLYIAHENAQGIAHIQALVAAGRVSEAMKFIRRGWTDRPDLGDDEAPFSLLGRTLQ